MHLLPRTLGGNNIDASFATTLEAVVKAFKDEGVHLGLFETAVVFFVSELWVLVC